MVKRPPTVGDHGEAYGENQAFDCCSPVRRRRGPVIRVTIFSPAGGHRR
jgi:hypothetical protein